MIYIFARIIPLNNVYIVAIRKDDKWFINSIHNSDSAARLARAKLRHK